MAIRLPGSILIGAHSSPLVSIDSTFPASFHGIIQIKFMRFMINLRVSPDTDAGGLAVHFYALVARAAFLLIAWIYVKSKRERV